jgi:hypothetical protein
VVLTMERIQNTKIHRQINNEHEGHEERKGKTGCQKKMRLSHLCTYTHKFKPQRTAGREEIEKK